MFKENKYNREKVQILALHYNHFYIYNCCYNTYIYSLLVFFD